MRRFAFFAVLLLASCATERFVKRGDRWVRMGKGDPAPTVKLRVEEMETTADSSNVASFVREFLSNLKPEPGGLFTKIYRVRYQDTKTVSDIVNRYKTKKGSVWTMQNTNTLLIKDTKEGLAAIAEALERLDISGPQVRIRLRVVELSRTGQLEYGFEYTQDRQKRTGGPRGFEMIQNPKNYLDSQKTGTVPFQGSTLTLFTRGKHEGSIDAIVRLFRELGDLKLHASPDILVSQKKKASIYAGEEVPYTTMSVSGQTVNYSVSFKPVGVTMEVTPDLVGYESARLMIKAEVSTVTGWTDPTATGVSNPIVSKRSAQTTVCVRDDEVLVLGGLLRERAMMTRRYIPILGDIPLLGYLFSAVRYETDSAELHFIMQVEIVSPVKPHKVPQPQPTNSGG